MWAWLKNASETENESSTSRSRCSSEQRPAPVDERQQEQQAQRQPHVQRIDVLAERPAIAARHRPGDLEARPLFEHAAGAIGDDHLADLLGALRGEEADLPAQRALQIGAAVGAGVFPAHRAHLWQRFGDFQNAVGGQVAAGGRNLGGRDGNGRFGDRCLGEVVGSGGFAWRAPSGGCNAPAAPATASAAGQGEQREQRERDAAARSARDAHRPRVTAARSLRLAAHAGRNARARVGRCRGSPTGAAPRPPSTPQRTSAPSESEACSEPWLPPPTWAAPPQSRNS